MAGITAYFTTQPDRHSLPEILAGTLASSFSLPGSSPVVVLTDDSAIVLGGNFPRHFQRKAQYVANREATILFYGELYNPLGGKEEAQFALDLIEGGSFEALKDLDGPFTLFHWDHHAKTLTVATDRLGRFPVFYFVHDGLTGVTTDLNSVLFAGVFPAALRLESVIDLLTIGFPLGDKSLFEGIERIAGGTIATISSTGVRKQTYWEPRSMNGPDDLERMMGMYAASTRRAVERFPRTAAALSGGWDTRATWAVLKEYRECVPAMTFGVRDSHEVEVASAIARRLCLDHAVIEPDQEFFNSFRELAEQVIMLGNGHVTVDLAFQLHVFERLADRYPRILDSAGCEFRRGRRAKVAAATASSSRELASFLLSSHGTGIWNASCISESLFHGNEHATREKLTGWLDDVSSPAGATGPERCADQIDAFASRELWGHSYAHGYHLQTNVIACSMPYTDKEMYDLTLQASRSLRWSHGFQQSVIRRHASELELFPIVHGDHKIPYGEDLFSSIPALYYHLIRNISSHRGAHALDRINNGKPFRPYRRWYSGELREYVDDMLHTHALASSGFVNIKGIETLTDCSHGISVLLTLSHLVSYVDRINRSVTREKPFRPAAIGISEQNKGEQIHEHA
jgi:glutamine amidotransferase-like protein